MAKILRKARARLHARQMDHEKTIKDSRVKNQTAYRRPGSLKR